jgi:hypothetical protein
MALPARRLRALAAISRGARIIRRRGPGGSARTYRQFDGAGCFGAGHVTALPGRALRNDNAMSSQGRLLAGLSN